MWELCSEFLVEYLTVLIIVGPQMLPSFLPPIFFHGPTKCKRIDDSDVSLLGLRVWNLTLIVIV